MEYTILKTDTATTLQGGDLTVGEWDTSRKASSMDKRQPASYAVGEAMDAALKVARSLAAEQGLNIVGYRGTMRDGAEVGIEDDGRIASAVADVRAAVEARTAKLAGQAPAPAHICAGAKAGCRNRVSSAGQYCASCAHDNE